MITPDIINALFEGFAAFSGLMNIKKLHEDKSVSGVHWWPSAIFALWGYWNIIFYGTLGQWWSLYIGIFVAIFNTIWVVMALYYRRKECTTKSFMEKPNKYSDK